MLLVVFRFGRNSHGETTAVAAVSTVWEQSPAGPSLLPVRGSTSYCQGGRFTIYMYCMHLAVSVASLFLGDGTGRREIWCQKTDRPLGESISNTSKTKNAYTRDAGTDLANHGEDRKHVFPHLCVTRRRPQTCSGETPHATA